MAPLSLTKVLLGLLSTSILSVDASPVVGPNSLYAEHAMRKRSNLVVRETTDTGNNVIDWVPIESQGKIAKAPPAKFGRVAATNASRPIAELMEPGAKLGPDGTVPIPQVDPKYLANVATKQLPPTEGSKEKRQNAGAHWYSSSNQGVNNIGGSAIYSLWKAYVANGGDFSLLQTAITKGSSKGGQTLEAGWINYPNQVSEPHLFTYYTTNGYSQQANNQGGWNQDVTGWVQTDNQIFPGTVFKPNNVDGGAQYEIEIEWYLYQGNWWLWVLDRWIGYYPAGLFSAGVSGDSLANGADGCFYYGEIYQNEGPLTTTDMGSGRFAQTGWSHSAYIHNMYFTGTDGFLHDYTAGFWDSDSNRYNHQNVVSSGSSWGSYVYLGGPGAGGVTNG